MNLNLLENKDFTLYQTGGKLMSGDFEINSVNSGNQIGGEVGGEVGTKLLENLALPLYYFSTGGSKKNYHKYDEDKGEDDKIIDNELFDKLLKMVEYKDERESEKEEKREKNKKRGTRKHKDIISKKKKSKKNKFVK